MPLDNETQNAIIDYVLNERRDCNTDYIFVTAVGATQKIARRHFRIKYRASREEIRTKGFIFSEEPSLPDFCRAERLWK